MLIYLRGQVLRMTLLRYMIIAFLYGKKEKKGDLTADVWISLFSSLRGKAPIVAMKNAFRKTRLQSAIIGALFIRKTGLQRAIAGYFYIYLFIFPMWQINLYVGLFSFGVIDYMLDSSN